jgi:DNA-binding MarR family transcriptional regulator
VAFAKVPEEACEALTRAGVSATTIKVYLALRLLSDYLTEECTASVTDLAKRVCTSTTRVAQAERALEGLGLLRREWSSKTCRKIVFPRAELSQREQLAKAKARL